MHQEVHKKLTFETWQLTAFHSIGHWKRYRWKLLEDFDYDAINSVSPYLGGHSERVCVLTEIGETTSAFFEYVGIENFLFKRHKSFEW